jgi:lysine 2,3-aminomutase
MNPIGLEYLCKQIELISSVGIVRIHTKVPIQAPDLVNLELLNKIVNSKKAFYFSVHINHPDELNSEVIEILNKIRRLGFLMLSQSVFLKGINDSSDILYTLFTGLSELGIRPYYIYHCQAIPTTKKFVMDLKKEIDIMTELRKRLSGIAYPSHVIDLQNAVGKITVPTNHWNFEVSEVRDFNDNLIKLDDYDSIN